MTTDDQPMDHVPPDAEPSSNEARGEMEKHFTSRSTWMRLVFMFIFAVLYSLSRVVLGAVIVIQFFYVLLTGETKEEMKALGHSLAIYSYQIVEYLTFNSETKPFPIDAPWPTSLNAEQFTDAADKS